MQSIHTHRLVIGETSDTPCFSPAATHRSERPEVPLLGEKAPQGIARGRAAIFRGRGQLQLLQLAKVAVHLGFPLHRDRVQARAPQQLELIVYWVGPSARFGQAGRRGEQGG